MSIWGVKISHKDEDFKAGLAFMFFMFVVAFGFPILRMLYR